MKRFLSFCLALLLLAGFLPVNAVTAAQVDEEPAYIGQTFYSTEPAEVSIPEETGIPAESVHEHSYDSVITLPTCETAGYTTYTCLCGESYTSDHRNPLGHDMGDWYGAPVCLTSGTQRRDCSRCDAYESRHVEATGHQYVPQVVAPTYTTEGYTEYICSACGDTYADDYLDSLELPAPSVRVEDGRLLWECADGISTFEIWRASGKSGKYTKIATVNENQWEDPEAEAGKRYYYKLRAVIGGGERFMSDFSNIVSVSTRCQSPVLELGYHRDTGKVVLQWGKVAGAKKYEVYRATAPDGKYSRRTTTTKLTYTDTKAAVGTTYYYKVKAIGSTGAYHSDWSNLCSGHAVLARPKVTVKLDAATGSPYLSWGKISGAAGYEILRTAAGQEAQTVSTQTGRTFTDNDAVPGTQYTYTVCALGAQSDCTGAGSAPQTVTATCARPVLQVAYTQDGKPVISWTGVAGADSYRLLRSTASSRGYMQIVTQAETVYTDQSAVGGKTYYYKVVALGDGYESAQSNYAKATGKCAVPAVTVAPNKAGKPVLSWDKVAGAKKYEIQRSVNGGAFKKLSTTSKTTYTDSKATSGTVCTYKIRALASSSSCHSQFSPEAACCVTCAAPTLTAKRNPATGDPVLSWKKVTNAAGYQIYRSDSGGAYTWLATVAGTSYEDSTAVADQKYTYRLQTVGIDPQMDSTYSNEKTVLATCGQAKLSWGSDSAGKPVISWEAVEDAVSYRLYRSARASSGYKQIAELAERSYTDETASAGKSYYYKVVAVSPEGEGAYSSYLKTAGKCAQPVISVGYHADSGKPVVRWEKVSGAKKYELWRSTSRDSGFRKLTTVTKNTYTDTTAEAGQFYYYQVRALGSSNSYHSQLSAARGCLTVCAKPVVSVQLDTALWKPSLSWKAVPGGASYRIYRATRGGEFTLLATVTGTSYTDRSARIGDTYRYQVLAVGATELSNSGKSEQVVFSLPCQNTAVSIGTDAATGKPVLTWEAVEGADIYAVYRSTKSGRGFKLCTQTRGTSYTDKGAKKGTTYYYYVTAMAQDTESAKSNTVKSKCK